MKMIKLRQKIALYNELIFLLFILPLTGCVALGMSSSDVMYKICFVFSLFWIGLKLVVTDYTKWDTGVMIAVFLLVTGVFLINGERTFVLSALAVAGAKDVDIKRILKYVMYTYILGMALTMLLALTGMGEDSIHALPKAGQIYQVHDFGFDHPNAAYNHLFMIAVLLLLQYSGGVSLLPYIALSMLMYGGYRLLLCRTGWLVYILLGTVLLLRRLLKGKRAYRTFINLWVLLPGIMAVLSICLALLYRGGYWLTDWINQMVTGRLYLFEQAISTLGISWYAPIGEYPYQLDNVYLYILLKYGAIVLFVYLSIYMLAMWYLKDKEDDMPVILLGILAVYGFMEYSFINVTWNPVMLYFSSIFIGRNMNHYHKIKVV